MRLLIAVIMGFSLLFATNHNKKNENITTNKTKIIVGIRAWKGMDMAYKEWSSTIDYLNKHIKGYEFKLYPLEKYDEIKSKIETKDIDFLICDPVLYIESEYLYGVTRLATLQRKVKGFYFDKFGSVIFTASKNKNINSFKDLKDTTFMGVAKEALAGYRMAHREMLQNEIVPEKIFKNIIFSGGRGDVVVNEVLKNDNYVGTVRTGLLENMIKKGVIKKDDIKILNRIDYDYFPLMSSTKLYPEFPFARLSHVPEELGKKVLIALLSIQEDSVAAKKGKYARWLIPNDYSDITNLMKELNVGIYKDFNKITIQQVIKKYWMALLGTFIFVTILILLSIRIKKQALVIEEEKDKASTLLDAQDSIVILSDGEYIKLVNKKFLEFFNILNLEKFINNYKCICDKFEYEEGKDYIQKFHKGKNWSEYIKQTPNEIHKVKIKGSDDNFHMFKINVTNYDEKKSLDVITLHDITDLENLEEQNRENQKLMHQQSKMLAIGEMIGNIAHQWRQPLSVISTTATGIKVLKEFDTLTDEQLINSVDKIDSTAQQMSKTIDDFRDFLKGDNKTTAFNLTKEINKCLEIEDEIIKQNSIKIIKDLDETITLDNLPHGLSQSLVSIINNAKDVMLKTQDKDNRFLFIETKQQYNKIYITLKDSGGGIDEDIISKIFEPYFTTKHQSQGTGLGLHMTYQIITENMHGKIEVNNKKYIYNEKEYKGAEFLIILHSIV